MNSDVANGHRGHYLVVNAEKLCTTQNFSVVVALRSDDLYNGRVEEQLYFEQGVMEWVVIVLEPSWIGKIGRAVLHSKETDGHVLVVGHRVRLNHVEDDGVGGSVCADGNIYRIGCPWHTDILVAIRARLTVEKIDPRCAFISIANVSLVNFHRVSGGRELIVPEVGVREASLGLCELVLVSNGGAPLGVEDSEGVVDGNCGGVGEELLSLRQWTHPT